MKKWKQISKNFSEDEFRCKGKNCCGGQVVIDYALVFALQKLRDYILDKTGKVHPIIITSGYRCPKHNKSKQVGGASNSAHLEGKAIDFFVRGLTLAQTWLYIERLGVNNFIQMGSYPDQKPSVIHVGNADRPFLRWVKRGGEYHYLF